ncbi:transposable element Tcb2 transposase [Trichonephila clavipes]|nr:transposable element Tcb2 transposase [Trichonephila clavipes]
MDAEFLFMDDNARPHRANIVDGGYHPNLNPIEHVWDMLGRRIAARQPLPTCLPELRRTLLDEWCNIPQDQVDNLILSMPRRYFIPNDDPRKEQNRYAAFLSRREPIFGESPISFPKDTPMPYSGFEPEPTQLQAERHNNHTGWGGDVPL